jgi:predicted nuclease of predicted toxin-antitoxin system
MNYPVVADESVDFRIVTQLRLAGIVVYSIAEQQPSIKDEQVLLIAVKNKALLITEDKDFGELVFRLGLPHCGILLIRIDDAALKISSVTVAIHQHLSIMLNRFSVLKNNTLRIKQ